MPNLSIAYNPNVRGEVIRSHLRETYLFYFTVSPRRLVDG